MYSDLAGSVVAPGFFMFGYKLKRESQF
jgi:hypothetical protein